MRFNIIYSYDGSKFYGYQKQPRKRTVQGEFEKILKKINNNKRTSLFSSGRTDAKVHALGQSGHFDLSIKINPIKLKAALNSLLPEDIYVRKVNLKSDEFHSRFDVKSKEYIYKINVGEYNPIQREYVYQYNKNLNLIKMKKASKYLIGSHNFKSFVKSDENKDFERTIYKINFDYNKKLNIIVVSIKGNGFMRFMVRNIVGTLIDIGSNKYDPKYIRTILESRDRRKAGKCAPACGLYLKDVNY